MKSLEGGVIIYDTIGTVVSDSGNARPNLVESFAALKSEGAKVFLTSSYTTSEVKEYAEALDISSYLDGCFGVSVFRGKSFKAITSVLGMSDADARHKLLITGDRIPHDAGIDNFGNVFVYDWIGNQRDAMVINDIAAKLYDKDQRSFLVGFDRLLELRNNSLQTDEGDIRLLYTMSPVESKMSLPTVYIK